MLGSTLSLLFTYMNPTNSQKITKKNTHFQEFKQGSAKLSNLPQGTKL